MKELLNFLDGPYINVVVDFGNSNWAKNSEIPNAPGWYFLSTDAPIDNFLVSSLWKKTYLRARDGVEVMVKNYDISKRAARYEVEKPLYWNLKWVYSGFASSLRSRAREHIFADPGTAALALARYPHLHKFSWTFHYVELRNFLLADKVSNSVILNLGEQVWRTKFGWPILCAS